MRSIETLAHASKIIIKIIKSLSQFFVICAASVLGFNFLIDYTSVYLTGHTLTFLHKFEIWYGMGVFLAIVGAWHYRIYIKPREYKNVLKGIAFSGAFGPLAIFTTALV